MSYILEALKKSDLERQRGSTPTLQAVQMPLPAPRRPPVFYYGLVGLVLFAGIMIGLLRPWQAEQAQSEMETFTQQTLITIPQQAAPAPVPMRPQIADKPVEVVPMQNAAPEVTQNVEAPVQQEPAEIVQEQQAMPFEDLPFAIQQEIPAMAVQLHAYSSKRSESLVSINSLRLRDGESLMPGLRLEQITPDGMIFSYKGYRFQRGIR